MLRAADVVVLCVLALLSLGVVMVSSAGMSVGVDAAPGVTLESILFSRSTMYMLLALCALGIGASLPLRSGPSVTPWAKWVPLLWPLSLGLLVLVYVPGVGVEINGARRWLVAPGGLTFQASEVAKWAAPALCAWYVWRRAGSMDRFFGGLLPALIILGSLTILVTREDLGTGVLIAAAGALVLIAGGARIWHFLMLTPVLLIGLLAALVTSPYRLRRIEAFIDPYADPNGTGYHAIQSLVAIANGKGFGRGLGFGLQKFGYLPEDRTDFLFAVVCEELGLAGATLIIALYVGLIVAAWSIVRRQQHMMIKLLGLGIVCTVGLQALMNLSVVTGLAPTKGIALPLMSSGGTGWVLTAFALGLIVAMGRRGATTTATRTDPIGDDEETPELAPAPTG
jgi:cell division protein FtsW